MTRPSRKTAVPRPTHHMLLVVLAALLVSILSFYYYFQLGEMLLYGDAVAHINIARRVFDSKTPGLLQLGTVWLPLSHLLMVPFLIPKSMWQTGIGGSIPSMLAYIFGVTGMFRLVRGILDLDVRTQALAEFGAWLAALVYAANPNLLYMQATAMTESLYLALFIWAVVYFSGFLWALRQGSDEMPSKLLRCGLCLAGAELTRYDGWFLAAAVGMVVVLLFLKRWHEPSFRRITLTFLVGIAIVPALWLAYNFAAYGNPWEFANGPYSAKAIENRTATPGTPPHPGTGHLVTAASYILKSGELNMASGNWGRIWVAISVAGLIVVVSKFRIMGAMLLLWIPLIFYSLSISYGGVPLFLPAWWPYTWYNMRYGLQLLPLFAASAGLLASIATGIASFKGPQVANPKSDPVNLRPLALAALSVLVIVLSYASVWKAQPLCFKEAWVNSRTRIALESGVARALRNLPRDANYLMYLGDHVGAFQQAGVPLKQVVNEGNHRPWKKPSDPEGLWERALTEPARYVDFVIAYEGDEVDRVVNKSGLTLIAEIHTTGQPRARIYFTRLALNQSR